jgi:hypothetical protein
MHYYIVKDISTHYNVGNFRRYYYMNDIDSRMIYAQNSWNKRLKKQMEIAGYTQTGLAKALKHKYDDSSTQTTIFRWLNAGNKLKGTGGFPKYENMIKIAGFLGVDVGFLTGETDSEMFSEQKAAEFLGLSVETVSAIRKLTLPSRSTRYDKMFSHDYADMLNRVMTSKALIDVLIALSDYKEPYDLLRRKAPDIFEEISKKYSIETISTAMKCLEGDYDNEDGPKLPEELCNAITEFSAASDKGYDWQLGQEEYRKEEKIYRYELQEATAKLLDDIYPQE